MAHDNKSSNGFLEGAELEPIVKVAASAPTEAWRAEWEAKQIVSRARSVTSQQVLDKALAAASALVKLLEELATDYTTRVQSLEQDLNLLSDDVFEEAEMEGRENDIAFEEYALNEDDDVYQECVLDEAAESPLSYWVRRFTHIIQGGLDGIDDSDIYYDYRERQIELAPSWSSVRGTQEQLDLVLYAIARNEIPKQYCSAWQRVVEYRVADIDDVVNGWLEFYDHEAEADFTSAIQLLRHLTDLPIEERASQEQDVRQFLMNCRRMSDARDELQETISAEADFLYRAQAVDNLADVEDGNCTEHDGVLFEDVAIPGDADTEDSSVLSAIYLTKRQLPVVVHSRVINIDIPLWVEQDLMTTLAMTLKYMVMAAPLNITAHTATLVFDPGGRSMRKSVHVRSS